MYQYLTTLVAVHQSVLLLLVELLGGVILLLMIIVVLCIVILCMKRSHRKKDDKGTYGIDKLNSDVILIIIHHMMSLLIIIHHTKSLKLIQWTIHMTQLIQEVQMFLLLLTHLIMFTLNPIVKQVKMNTTTYVQPNDVDGYIKIYPTTGQSHGIRDIHSHSIANSPLKVAS